MYDGVHQVVPRDCEMVILAETPIAEREHILQRKLNSYGQARLLAPVSSPGLWVLGTKLDSGTIYNRAEGFWICLSFKDRFL